MEKIAVMALMALMTAMTIMAVMTIMTVIAAVTAIVLIFVPGVPKKSIPKIKVVYKKSWSGIKSKPYCLNTLEGLDLIL